jgi:hypothetical protein
MAGAMMIVTDIGGHTFLYNQSIIMGFTISINFRCGMRSNNGNNIGSSNNIIVIIRVL